MIRVVYPGSGSRFFIHPGSRGKKTPDPGSGSAKLVTNTFSLPIKWQNGKVCIRHDYAFSNNFRTHDKYDDIQYNQYSRQPNKSTKIKQ
jgi:hypothetical protein